MALYEELGEWAEGRRFVFILHRVLQRSDNVPPPHIRPRSSAPPHISPSIKQPKVLRERRSHYF